MTRALVPLVALVGCKRNKFSIAGRNRVLTVRDGELCIRGRKGAIDLEAPVDAVTARLTRARTVELRTDTASVFIFGSLELSKIHRELQEIVADESDGAYLIGPVPTGALGMYSPLTVVRQVDTSRAIVEALHERGVGQG